MKYERPRHVRGIHGSPGTYNMDYAWWLDELQAMDMALIKLLDDGSGSAINFARECKKRGIMPIVRLWRDRPNPGTLSDKAIRTAKQYVDEGITRWFEVNNEPNLDCEWKQGVFPEGDVIGREWWSKEAVPSVAENWLLDAQAIIRVGGYPGFPAMAECGHHGRCGSIPWYTALFQYLATKQMQVAKAVFQNGGWIASHDAVFNHATEVDGEWRFDYPYDPIAQTSSPGKTILADDNSLIGHQVPVHLLWYYFHLNVPVISTEGGVFYSIKDGWNAQVDSRYPAIDEWRHAILTVKMFEWLQAYQKVYPWYFGICPWLLSGLLWGHPGSAWEEECWYQNGKTFTVVSELKQWQQGNPPALAKGKYGKIIAVDFDDKIDNGDDENDNGDGNTDENDNGNGEEINNGVEYVGLSPEMIERLEIQPATDLSEPYWQVYKVEIQPETDHQSAFAVIPLGVQVGAEFSWPEGVQYAEPKADVYAPKGARHWAASMPMYAPWGPYRVKLQGNSEQLRGFGLYQWENDHFDLTKKGHHPVLVYFEKVDAIEPEPGPPPVGEFPRPKNDNGLGIHLSVDDMDEQSVARQIAWMKDMRLKWGVVADGSEEVVVRIAGQLWAAGIMPISRWIGNISKAHDFARDAQLLIKNDIPPYVQIFNEPSDDREWKNGRPANYIDKWASLWAMKASEVAAVGGYPGLQCLHPEELEKVFNYLPADSPAWRRVWFCSHNYGLNHPPDWHGDEWCVLGFEDFVQSFSTHLGFVPPIICGEGGWLFGASDDPTFPEVDATLHAAYHKAMFEWFRVGKLSDGKPLPDYLYAICPWILAGNGSEPWYGDTVKVQTIDAVKSIPEFVRGQQEIWNPPVDRLAQVALGWLGEIPVPSNFAFPSYATKKGYPIQVSRYGQLEHKSKVWAWQIFSNKEQTEFIVVYAVEGRWDKIEHTVIKQV